MSFRFSVIIGVQGTSPNRPFGKRLLYKHWKVASTSLGVDDLDLYGARHTTITAMAITVGKNKDVEGRLQTICWNVHADKKCAIHGDPLKTSNEDDDCLLEFCRDNRRYRCDYIYERPIKG